MNYSFKPEAFSIRNRSGRINEVHAALQYETYLETLAARKPGHFDRNRGERWCSEGARVSVSRDADIVMLTTAPDPFSSG